jgi:glucose-6-phosphate isomerase
VLLAGGADGVVGFGDWTEQLLAESTGKEGRGLLPVVLEGPDAPGFASSADGYRVLVGATGPSIDADAGVAGPLGGLFLAWEYATAVAGRLLGINPFDQPNVQESKDNTQRVLDEAGDGPLPEEKPLFNDGAIDVHADPGWLGGADDVTGALRALLGEVPESGYLAVMAYLDRLGDAAAGGLRASLARRTSRPVTFGWGPRFLHSTGQFHKGGPPVGVFLQVTGAHVDDVAVPDRPYTLGRLQHAQALGDLLALRKRDRPVLRLHLRDRPTGLRQLLAAADALG